MIQESGPWKKLLLIEARRIESASRRGISEQRAINLERGIFLSAYIVRKLHEAKKLSSGYDDQLVPIQSLPNTGKTPDWTNIHRWEQFFDIGRATSARLKAPRVVNVVIHSLILVTLMAEGDRVVGFFVTSDHASKQALYAVDLQDWIGLIRQVANDDVTEVTRHRLPDGSWQETRAGWRLSP